MTNRILPPLLKPGDKIAIAAPARKISRDELAFAINEFESWGLEVVLHELLFEQHHQLAGTDSIRTEVFQSYINNSEVKAIIAARGGYGSVKIIDQLDFSPLRLSPKWIIGYSDITVFHSHLHTNTNLCTLHAAMPINMLPEKLDGQSVLALKSLLMGDEPFHYELNQHPMNVEGEATAELVGGNLSVLYSLLGSVSDINTKGKILFIEDLDEYLYHVDRMMMALDRAGKLNQLEGLIVGGMSDMKDNQVPFGMSAEEIILERVKNYGYPVCFGFPAGHEKVNLPLVFGNTHHLKVRSSEIAFQKS
ncbi:MAG: LD-carboxypeptidase [Bacteroidota bacterium]